ncbi:hypothetical protein F4557_000288 [Actinomadura catellatispora]|uniref:Uncharacterized protein n=1 Tax=Actinomadura livida TaxID=79909 RepID=A0A7W7I7H8_9ACTN|nr:hypothetical protein [Actinomadura catellatispora]
MINVLRPGRELLNQRLFGLLDVRSTAIQG